MFKSMLDPILEVKGLKTSFFKKGLEIKAVDDVSFTVFKGRMLGVVGESGSGKTAIGLSILRLIPSWVGRTVGGQILFQGSDLLKLTHAQMRAVRGLRISMVFQEAFSALNPVLTIGDQISEAIRAHQRLSKNELKNRSIEMLELVKIPDAKLRATQYPHQLSGGMRQRVMLAIALSCNPEILIADEPTTSLDAVLQIQILDLLKQIQRQTGLAVIFITHDLTLVERVADAIVVIYAGKIVEQGEVSDVFSKPKMPYTQGFLKCMSSLSRAGKKRLREIPGAAPGLITLPGGCSFQDRCPDTIALCRNSVPELREIESNVRVASLQPHCVRCVRAI